MAHRVISLRSEFGRYRGMADIEKPIPMRLDLRVHGLALQLPFLTISESMGNHDSKIVDADSVD
jgi:hypothetical protein